LLIVTGGLIAEAAMGDANASVSMPLPLSTSGVVALTVELAALVV